MHVILKNEATANLQLLDNKITQTQAADMLNVSPLASILGLLVELARLSWLTHRG
jgi:hypothetical protein